MGLPYETTCVETRHGVTHATLTGKWDGKPLVVIARAVRLLPNLIGAGIGTVCRLTP